MPAWEPFGLGGSPEGLSRIADTNLTVIRPTHLATSQTSLDQITTRLSTPLSLQGN